jgi:hypothetical protein
MVCVHSPFQIHVVCSKMICSDKLRKYFSNFGTVLDAVVMKDPISRRSRGFGFITFSDIAAVDKVLDNMPHTIDQRKVEAKRSVPRESTIRAGATHMDTTDSVASTSPSALSNASMSTNSSPTSQSQPQSIPPQPQPNPQSTHQPSPHHSGRGGGYHGFNNRGGGFQAGGRGRVGGGSISSTDFSARKIFVGGLHYETRVGASHLMYPHIPLILVTNLYEYIFCLLLLTFNITQLQLSFESISRSLGRFLRPK